MHCLACNCLLSDLETTRKDVYGSYVELCNVCLYPIRKDITLSNNFDLNIIDEDIADD